MDRTYRRYDPEQLLLLPPALQDWLPEDHVVYFLSDLVDHLDLSAITNGYEQEVRGYPPYHPRMMVKLLLYAYTLAVARRRPHRARPPRRPSATSPTPSPGS